MTAQFTRRQALATLGLGAAALAGGTVPSACSAFRRRPNVVLFVADDLGSVDLRCYGSKDLLTPHIDALAYSGVRFSQFYVTAPACTPSRASMLTGRHFPRVLRLGHGINPAETTIAEMLKPAGYHTACIGKWHLGFDDGMYADDQGFDEFFGHRTGAMDNYSHHYYWGGPDRHVMWRNKERWHEEGSYFPDLMVRESVRFIEQNKDEPFFLYMPFNIPHYPIQPDPAARERYGHIENASRREYAALVSTLDDRVGMIMAKLEELDLRDNTIVIFLSDHGHSTEERSGGGGSAGILRGGKMTLWEGGLRVPAIISWPAHISGRQLRPQPVTALDLLPTLAEFCDVPLPQVEIDGASLASVCASDEASSPHDALYWVYKEDWAVREGPWKIVGQGDDIFLANLALDPTETIDHAKSHRHVQNRLVDLHNRWILKLSQDANVASQAPAPHRRRAGRGRGPE
jgi:arylsulfatase A-like enzyme